MASVEKNMNHTEYPRKIKSLTSSSLRYIIKDCRAALDAFPENPNAGYYEDEIHYCAMELQNRNRK